MTPALMLRLEIVSHMYWQGRLIVVSVVAAGYLTNSPFFFHSQKAETFPVGRTFDSRTYAESLNSSPHVLARKIDRCFCHCSLLLSRTSQTFFKFKFLSKGNSAHQIYAEIGGDKCQDIPLIFFFSLV